MLVLAAIEIQIQILFVRFRIIIIIIIIIIKGRLKRTYKLHFQVQEGQHCAR